MHLNESEEVGWSQRVFWSDDSAKSSFPGNSALNIKKKTWDLAQRALKICNLFYNRWLHHEKWRRLQGLAAGLGDSKRRMYDYPKEIFKQLID